MSQNLYRPPNSSSANRRNSQSQSYNRDKLYDLGAKESRNLARRIFEYYNKSRSGVLEESDISNMIKDSYRGVNDDYEPSSQEITSYKAIHDKNGDGIITLEDIENRVAKYLGSTMPGQGKHVESLYEE